MPMISQVWGRENWCRRLPLRVGRTMLTGFKPTLGARLRLSSTSLRKRAVMAMTAHA